ncbi:MAG: hypothetical protein V4671_09500 [Armatimonadota bacterium]
MRELSSGHIPDQSKGKTIQIADFEKISSPAFRTNDPPDSSSDCYVIKIMVYKDPGNSSYRYVYFPKTGDVGRKGAWCTVTPTARAVLNRLIQEDAL